MSHLSLIQLDDHIATLEENGKSVFLQDCLKYVIQSEERIFLFRLLRIFTRCVKENLSLDDLINDGFIKKLDRQSAAIKYEVWEIRDPGRDGRLIFIFEKPDSVIVSAVSKRISSLSQAINRGINRWENYLKQLKDPLKE